MSPSMVVVCGFAVAGFLWVCCRIADVIAARHYHAGYRARQCARWVRRRERSHRVLSWLLSVPWGYVVIGAMLIFVWVGVVASM